MQSSLHKKVSECLNNSPIFSGFKIFEEYPVSKVNPSYKTNRHRFDFVITDIHLVIEVHGVQHYKATSFGAEAEDAVMSFQEGQLRDRDKMYAAQDAGYTYIAIPYWDIKNLTDTYIWDLYQKHKSTDNLLPAKEDKYQTFLKSNKHKEQLEKARQTRKEKYLRFKEWKKNANSK